MLVPAGRPGSGPGRRARAGPGPRPAPPRPLDERLGRMGVALTVLGAGLQLASIVARGLAAGRWPLGNMYEFSSAICLVAVLAWLVVLRRWPAARPAGPFLLLPVVMLLFLAGTVLYAQAAPVMPALQSYWLVVHVTTVALASGLFFVPGVASLLYLLRRSGRLPGLARPAAGGGQPGPGGLPHHDRRLPALHVRGDRRGDLGGGRVGPVLGLGPQGDRGVRRLGASTRRYLHARATAGWRTGRAAWINVAGLAAIVFNFFFINMVVSGLHSYAGLG